MLIRKLLATTLFALALTPAAASFAQSPTGLAEPGDPTSARPGILSKIAIDQKIGQELPLDLPFVDDSGRAVRLGEFSAGARSCWRSCTTSVRCSARRC